MSDFSALGYKERNLTPAELKKIDKIIYAGMINKHFAQLSAVGLQMNHAGLDVHYDELGSYALVAGTTIYWPEGVLTEFDDSTCMYIYMHEVAHLALGHMWRLREQMKKDRATANVAADMELYNVLENLVQSAGQYISHEGLSIATCPPEFAELSAEEIFGRLYQKKIEQRGQQRSQSGTTGQKKPGPCGGNYDDQASSNGAGAGEPGDDNGDDDGGSGNEGNEGGKNEFTVGAFVPADEKQQADIEDMLNKVASFVNSAGIDGDRSCGKTPGVLDERIRALNRASEIPWDEKLASWVSNVLDRVLNDWSRPHSRSYSTGIIWPKKKPDEEARFFVCVDTSGSVPSRMMEAVFSEIGAAMSVHRNTTVTVIQADCEVKSVETISSENLAEWLQNGVKVYGRGGTAYEPSFNEIRRMIEADEPHAAGVIYMTDGEVTVEDYRRAESVANEIGLPVIWVIFKVYDSFTMPTFGDVVQVRVN